ncbi:hypothetical protein M9H77_01913 [Catharanthus roseus]|uniref:Uncharacterized protein n=1 Tax=Catharanthus roseus TaxID=4058 RepID=A0ACC0C6X3_CATRO|nr:hypothetical protein M9H77_01913 [Catharanthus roseus]
MTMRVSSFYEEHHMFYFTLYSMNNDNKISYLWTIAPNLAKEGIQSDAFLDVGLGSPIDDLIEYGILRLLDWNDSMTDIQLDMRFVDKVQAISAVRKWLIWMGCEYRVMKSKSDQLTTKCYHHSDSYYCSCHLVANDPEMPVSNVIQEVQVLFQTGCMYKRAWYAQKFAIEKVLFTPHLSKFQQDLQEYRIKKLNVEGRDRIEAVEI